MAEGNITVEHTVWCGSCAFWQQYQERNKGRTSRAARKDGWRLKKGKWTCPTCVAGPEPSTTKE